MTEEEETTKLRGAVTFYDKNVFVIQSKVKGQVA